MMDQYSFTSESRLEAVEMMGANPYFETPAPEPVEEKPVAQAPKAEPAPEPILDIDEKISADPVDAPGGTTDTGDTSSDEDNDVDGGDSVEPSSTTPEFDDLQRAYSAAQEELARERAIAAEREAQLAHLTQQLQAPQAVSFEELDENAQDDVLKEAKAHGVTVETVLYNRHKDAERAFASRESKWAEAGQQLVGYIKQHPKRATLGERVSQMLAEPSSPFAFANYLRLVMPPEQFVAHSLAEVDRCFKLAELEAKATSTPKPAAPNPTANQKQKLKAATRGEASRPGAASSQSSNATPDPQEDALAAMMSHAARNRMLDGLMV